MNLANIQKQGLSLDSQSVPDTSPCDTDLEDVKALMLYAPNGERLKALRTEYGFTDGDLKAAWGLMTKEEKEIVRQIASKPLVNNE